MEKTVSEKPGDLPKLTHLESRLIGLPSMIFALLLTLERTGVLLLWTNEAWMLVFIHGSPQSPKSQEFFQFRHWFWFPFNSASASEKYLTYFSKRILFLISPPCSFQPLCLYLLPSLERWLFWLLSIFLQIHSLCLSLCPRRLTLTACVT